MKNLLGNKIAWLVVVAVAGAAAFIFGGNEPAATAASQHIESATVTRGDITRSIAATGRVRALVTVEVGSQLSGRVEDLLVDFNDTVKKGDIVAKIDPQTFEQRVLQAKADLESARAAIAVQEATVVRSEAALKQAELDFKRQEPLARDGTIAQATLDATRANRDGARASLDISKAQVASAEATYKQREASLRSAEIDLERTQIKSPIDGVVIERNVDQGQTVAASLSAPTLFKIAQDLTEIQIEASVDESDIGRVRAGNTVSFTVDAHEDQTFSGEVEEVRLSPVELNNVVTYTVIVNASNPRLLLLPGMTANLEIKTGERSGVLRLPNEALRVRATDDMKAQAEEAAASSDSGEQGQRRRGRGEAMGRLLTEIGVSEETQAEIQTQSRALFQQMRTQMQQMPDRAAAREMMRSRMDKILRDNLSSEEYAKLQAARQAQEQVRRAQVWVKQPDGTLVPVNVRLGIADDSFSELLGGLEEGTEVVTRIRQVRS